MKNFNKLFKLIIIAFIIAFITPNLAPAANNLITVSAAKTKLNKTKLTIIKGETYTLKLKNHKSNRKIKWSSSNKKIATVSNDGKVKAKKAGTATITAQVDNEKYQCIVTVNNKPKLSNTKLKLGIDETYNLILENNHSKIKWSSSNKKIASVNSKGVVLAKKTGSATITARAGNKKYQCKITVVKKPGSKDKPLSAYKLNTFNINIEGEQRVIQLQLEEYITTPDTVCLEDNVEIPSNYEWVFMKFYLNYVQGEDEIAGDELLNDDSFYNSICSKQIYDIRWNYIDFDDYDDGEYIGDNNDDDDDYNDNNDYSLYNSYDDFDRVSKTTIPNINDIVLMPSDSTTFYLVFACPKNNFPITYKINSYNGSSSSKSSTWFTTKKK